MALFVATITSDFGNISGYLLFFLSFTTCGWSGISFSCEIRLFAPFLAVFLFFLFSGLLRGLLGLGNLFNQVGLIFSLQSLLVNLIVPRIKTHLQRLFLFESLLI